MGTAWWHLAAGPGEHGDLRESYKKPVTFISRLFQGLSARPIFPIAISAAAGQGTGMGAVY